jgi:hypothetical protein
LNAGQGQLSKQYDFVRLSGRNRQFAIFVTKEVRQQGVELAKF